MAEGYVKKKKKQQHADEDQWKRVRFEKMKCEISEHTSWYTDGLDKEGTVKDNTLLCPSLSTISWNARGRDMRVKESKFTTLQEELRGKKRMLNCYMMQFWLLAWYLTWKANSSGFIDWLIDWAEHLRTLKMKNNYEERMDQGVCVWSGLECKQRNGARFRSPLLSLRRQRRWGFGERWWNCSCCTILKQCIFVWERARIQQRKRSSRGQSKPLRSGGIKKTPWPTFPRTEMNSVRVSACVFERQRI